MTEAVPLGELLHEEAIFGLTGVRKVGVPRGRLFPSGLCLSAIPRVVWAWPDPLPTRLRRVGKNVQTLWWAELDQSSIAAHVQMVMSTGKNLEAVLNLATVHRYTVTLYNLTLYTVNLYTVTLYTVTLYTVTLYTVTLCTKAVHNGQN